MGAPILVAGDGAANVTLTSPYALPFRVRHPRDLGTGTRDLILRVVLADAASTDAVEALDSTVIPFLLMVTSGALAGESIPPWTSSVDSWEDPVVRGPAMEWSLKSVTCDPQAWVVLAQMFLIDHKVHPIAGVEVLDSNGSSEMTDVMTGVPRVNPYPKSWAGIRFPIEFYGDLPKSFTVFVEFERPFTESEKESIEEECSAWAPGLMLGAYGVAPVPPEKCTGLPDEEVVFVDRGLEWQFSAFKAHSGAIEGLINVMASISEKIVPVTHFRID